MATRSPHSTHPPTSPDSPHPGIDATARFGGTWLTSNPEARLPVSRCRFGPRPVGLSGHSDPVCSTRLPNGFDALEDPSLGVNRQSREIISLDWIVSTIPIATIWGRSLPSHLGSRYRAGRPAALPSRPRRPSFQLAIEGPNCCSVLGALSVPGAHPIIDGNPQPDDEKSGTGGSEILPEGIGNDQEASHDKE